MRLRPDFLALVLCLSCPAAAIAQATYTWNRTTTGTFNWNDPANWVVTNGVPGTFPNAAGVIAQNLGTGSSTVTQNVAAGVTVGAISLGGSSDISWTFSGANPIILNNNGSGVTISNINSSTGSVNTLDVIGPGLVLADNLTVSNTGGSTNVFGAIQLRSVISGTGNLTLSNANTALSQAGSLRLQTGANTFTGSVLVQQGTTTYNRSDSFGNSANVITLGQTGQGSAAVLNTAGVTVANNIVVASGTGGAVTLGGISTANSTYSGNMTLNGDLTLFINSSAANSYTFSGLISGVGGINKVAGNTNSGTAVLTNANTYSGGTLISGGTLRLGASGSIANTSSITLASGTTFDVAAVSGGFVLGGTTGQTLQGSGTVVGAVTVGNSGTIEAGNAGLGTLNVNDNLSVQSGGTVRVEIGGGTGTGTSDTLNLSGGTGSNTLSLATGSNLTLINSGFNATADTTFTLANLGPNGVLVIGGITIPDDTDLGTFSTSGNYLGINVTLVGFSGGEQFALRRTADSVQLTISPVPEPSLLLAVCGLAVSGVAVARRLRRKKADLTPAA